ncbi:hypothetical protein ANN_09978 [Periplaneta americana]|uniref:Myb/SANT-like DNA-binding domain-containing protein n=1 Tax=Periplaneta americana TaxID=6978 RepID=A0ABQ8TNT0_PERAM|nr:hypothetical protein ANN_09978 [Periplaneta americana]
MNEHKYMWNHAGTALLISIWSDSSVQKQLRATLRNQPIWDGVARFMMRKGFRVNGKQCRTRIKNILVRYREVKKTGIINGSGIEPFYTDVDRVMTARNLQTATETTSRGAANTDPLDLVEPKHNYQQGTDCVDQEMVQVNIKSEQNSPPTMSDDSVQELQDNSQDSNDQQHFFQAVDVTLDDDQSSSSMHMTSSTSRRSPLSVLQSDDAVTAREDTISLVQENGHSSLHTSGESHSRDNMRGMNSSRRGTTMRLERLVLRAMRAQSEAVTKVLNAQNELFVRMMEADRERQARVETKLDRLMERLDQSFPVKDREHDSQLSRLLDRLDWAASSRALEISSRSQESKLNSLLDKLDRLLPHKPVGHANPT